MNDTEFLLWLADRLVYVYNESDNTDIVRRTREIAEKIKHIKEEK